MGSADMFGHAASTAPEQVVLCACGCHPALKAAADGGTHQGPAISFALGSAGPLAWYSWLNCRHGDFLASRPGVGRREALGRARPTASLR